MNAKEALDWLYGTQLFGIKLGLENMQRLLAALDLPKPGQRFIHVAGTNGKGSTCAFIAAICREAGMCTGLFTSPHLISFCERIQINGTQIPDEDLAAGLTRLRELTAGWDARPTFFELATALAIDWFARKGTDIIVLETGMGGRLDATNAITPVVSVITSIAFDHEQWLGNTLTQIAGEKAGIIKPGVPVVSAPQLSEAAAVLRDVAWNQNADLVTVREAWTAGPVSLAGEHQRWNAATAVAAVRAASLGIPAEAIERGLASARWPARFQRFGANLVLDGAHNPAGAAALTAAWREVFGHARARVIFGAVSSKDVRGVLRELAGMAAEFTLVVVNSPRALQADQLAKVCREAAPETPFQGAIDLASAIQSAKEGGGLTLITGSLYLCGEALALLQPGAAFQPSAQ